MFGAPLQMFGRFCQLQQIQTWPSPTLFIRPSSGLPVTTLVLQSDDTLWYPVSAIQLSTGNATLSIGAATSAGVKPYRILANVSDGLNYSLALETIDGTTSIAVDEIPSALPVDSVIMISDAGPSYTLALKSDPKPTWQLTPL